MECVHPTAEFWKDMMKDATDEKVATEFAYAWKPGNDHNIGSPYGQSHHDWTLYRAITLREARKRGFDVSTIVPAHVLGT